MAGNDQDTTAAAVQSCPLAGGQAMEVCVIGADRRPLADVAVELLRAPNEAIRLLSGSDGVVRVDGLGEGEYSMSLCELDKDAWSLDSTSALSKAAATSPKPAVWQPPFEMPRPTELRHRICAGESTISLAELHGHFAHTVWNDPGNQALRARRRDMNALLPGDELAIPARRRKTIAVQSGNRYVLKRNGIPAIYRLQVIAGGLPIGRCPYLLTVDEGLVLEGWTDPNGVLATWLPAQSREGKLEIQSNGYWSDITLNLRFGSLGPVEEDQGVAQRLENLGMLATLGTSHSAADLETAIRRFQGIHGLGVTGVADDATRECLCAVHDQLSHDEDA